MVRQCCNYFTISSKPALSIKKNNETEQELGPQMQGKQQRNRVLVVAEKKILKNPVSGL
jgi:hypothetical protein